MRIMRGAILCSAGLLFGGADAFAPSFATPLHMTGQSPNIAMVSTKEVFGQLYEASPPVQKTMSGLPTPVAKGAGAALMAATGAAGFLLTPSRRLAVSAVGGGLTAAIGNIGRKRLEEERTKAAVPAVAALLAEGLQNVTPDRLASIMDEYGVPKKQFDEQLGELYLAFLSATLNSAEVQTAELSELKKLKDLLKLSPAQAGNQVYGAARQMFSRHRAYLEDTEPNDSKKLLEKFVFLAERIISDDESPEGYRYESLRLQKLFSLTATDWRSRRRSIRPSSTARPSRPPSCRPCVPRLASRRAAPTACTSRSSRSARRVCSSRAASRRPTRRPSPRRRSSSPWTPRPPRARSWR
jgi:hypothetical protein